ncbi:uncharacterized protein LOC134836917 [Culicoides brevitarsis]|uniref:uncharacterized protein LOC134836917 n=1 Tax=Culicoides brevitarsis TaxID=469753 RepID=UPI00307B7A8E
MNFLVSILFLFVVWQVDAQDTEAAVEQIINSKPVCDQNKTVQCGRSCGEYYVCRRGLSTPLSVNRCPTDRPFCNIGTHVDSCHTQRDPSRFTCQPLPFLFQCTDAGYFPDPMDCSSYFICEPFENRFNPTRKTCPEGLVYESRLRRCTAVSVNNPCRTITCENGTSDFQAYPGNAGYFYNCVDRSINVPSGKIPVIYRCPTAGSGTNVAFNATTRTCSYACNGSGRMWVSDAAREFYQCTSGKQALLERCPQDFRFNSNNGLCVTE